jgi:hypothetical protein
MYARFVTDPVVEELSFEDQRHYVFLLCLKCDGLLDKEFPDPAMRERAIARRLGLQGEAFQFAHDRLIASGLIDADWHPKSWDDLQFKSDSSRDRQRKWRERHRNVTVTAQDEDKDEDKENIKKKNSEAQKAPSKNSKADQLRSQVVTFTASHKVSR